MNYLCHCGHITIDKPYCELHHFHLINGEAIKCNGGLMCFEYEKREKLYKKRSTNPMSREK